MHLIDLFKRWVFYVYRAKTERVGSRILFYCCNKANYKHLYDLNKTYHLFKKCSCCKKNKQNKSSLPTKLVTNRNVDVTCWLALVDVFNWRSGERDTVIICSVKCSKAIKYSWLLFWKMFRQIMGSSKLGTQQLRDPTDMKCTFTLGKIMHLSLLNIHEAHIVNKD